MREVHGATYPGPHVLSDRPQPAFRLYLGGPGPQSDAIERAVRAACDRVHGSRWWTLEVVDLGSEPQAAEAAPVLLVPTLERIRPHPSRRWLGDLTDAETLARAIEAHDD